MRWAKYSHSAVCYSLRDWFAAMRMYSLVKLQIVHFLGISWFYCYCCWTFINCEKCGHIFKGWCAGDLFLFFWALISGRASIVQATRPDLGQKSGEVFGSSLLCGLSPFSQILFSLVFFPTAVFGMFKSPWAFMAVCLMKFHGSKRMHFKVMGMWNLCYEVIKVNVGNIITPHPYCRREPACSPIYDWWTVCCFGITLNTKQQNAELDQHLSLAQKGNVENFNMLDVDRCLGTVVLAITDPTIWRELEEAYGS
jgi:hypothetical protein